MKKGRVMKVHTCMKCNKRFTMLAIKPRKDDWCYACNRKFVKVRSCLMCGKKFVSEGAHNRLCTPCRCDNAIMSSRDAEKMSAMEREVV